jgi:hypothetical protein
MIDLARTEQQMLAEIGAQSGPGQVVAPGASVMPAPEEALLVVRGRTPDKLLPMLMETFSRRYAFLPQERVFADLSRLVKKGLGNAFKWGHDSDPSRVLTVRAVMTNAGAVVAIVDEGPGFGVQEVLGQFHHEDAYFRHGGSGFSHFHETRSVISYADGGRTLLIRFLCANGPGRGGGDGAGVVRSRRRSRPHLGVQRFDGSFLAAKVSVKPAEACKVIDARVQHVDEAERRIGVLGAAVRLSDRVEIAGPDQRRLGIDALRAGQFVELAGTYSPEQGFVVVKVQIRPKSAQFEEIQGTIDEIRRADGTFSVLGVTVMTDVKTEVKDKRPS